MILRILHSPKLTLQLLPHYSGTSCLGYDLDSPQLRLVLTASAMANDSNAPLWIMLSHVTVPQSSQEIYPAQAVQKSGAAGAAMANRPVSFSPNCPRRMPSEHMMLLADIAAR
jgi:hypothetical protein